MIELYVIGSSLSSKAWTRIREYCIANDIPRYWLDPYNKAKHHHKNTYNFNHFIITVECSAGDLMQIKLLVNDDILYITDLATNTNVTTP